MCVFVCVCVCVCIIIKPFSLKEYEVTKHCTILSLPEVTGTGTK